VIGFSLQCCHCMHMLVSTRLSLYPSPSRPFLRFGAVTLTGDRLHFSLLTNTHTDKSPSPPTLTLPPPPRLPTPSHPHHPAAPPYLAISPVPFGPDCAIHIFDPHVCCVTPARPLPGIHQPRPSTGPPPHGRDVSPTLRAAPRVCPRVDASSRCPGPCGKTKSRREGTG
jgi:hypothetical protein